MHLIASPLLIFQSLAPRERAQLSAPYRYWISAAREQQRWLLASRGVGRGLDVTAGTAAQRRQQRAQMRNRRAAFLQEARQQRERVRHEMAQRLADLGQALQA